ncbi:hypothetical protein JQN58_39115 [Aneurinibacillus sp. BA2021]|nr:hypothetical protein [Aneurinibacillus sp. BA2021]
MANRIMPKGIPAKKTVTGKALENQRAVEKKADDNTSKQEQPPPSESPNAGVNLIFWLVLFAFFIYFAVEQFNFNNNNEPT